jgi:hypothetical protein
MPVVSYFAGQATASGTDHTQILVLGEQSYNLYVKDEMLVNYNGRSDLYIRDEDDPGGDNDLFSFNPPSTNQGFDNIFYFPDQSGGKNVVFTHGGKLCVKVNNTYKILVDSDLGRLFYFLHEGKLIILSESSYPLVWDGVAKPTEFGVREIPEPPWVNVLVPPGMSWNLSGHTPWEYTSIWGNQKAIAPGPGDQYDSSDPPVEIDGYYAWACQYVDRFGNVGPVSPGSSICKVPNGRRSSPNNWYYPVVTVSPSLSEQVFWIQAGRTANLHQDDVAGMSGYGTFYIDNMLSIAESSYTSIQYDNTIRQTGQMKTGFYGPPKATIGCSHKGRIYLAGLDNPCLVIWSESGGFGNFSDGQAYKSRGTVTALVTMGDRLCVITDTSIDVLYEGKDGPQVLSIDDSVGAKFGLSMTPFANGVIGYFNSGFGLYDGSKVVKIEIPWFFEQPNSRISGRAVSSSDSYFVPVVFNSTRCLLMFRNGSMFRLNEGVSSLAFVEDKLLGTDDSLYCLFSGRWQQSCLSINGIVPPNSLPHLTRRLMSIRIMANAGGLADASVFVFGRYEQDALIIREFPFVPSENANDRNTRLFQVWDSLDEYGARWASPGDHWIIPSGASGPDSMKHSVEFVFPENQNVAIRFVAIEFSLESASW